MLFVEQFCQDSVLYRRKKENYMKKLVSLKFGTTVDETKVWFNPYTAILKPAVMSP